MYVGISRVKKNGNICPRILLEEYKWYFVLVHEFNLETIVIHSVKVNESRFCNHQISTITSLYPLNSLNYTN